MPPKNRFAEMQPEIAAWRRDLHQHPEILFEVHRTAGIVEVKLREELSGPARGQLYAEMRRQTENTARRLRDRFAPDLYPDRRADLGAGDDQRPGRRAGLRRASL